MLEIELAKTKQAIQIGDKTGLFYVPRVIDFRPQEGVLEFERIEGLCDFQEMIIRNDNRRYGFLEKLGQGLAITHETITLASGMKKNLPDEWMRLSEDYVFLHGDLSAYNICYQEQTERLVVLDWSTSPLLGGSFTYGPRTFDLAWFIYSIFFHLPAGCIANWNAPGMANAFLRGYIKYHQKDLGNDMRRLQRQVEHFRRYPYWRYILRSGAIKYVPAFTIWFWKYIRYYSYRPVNMDFC